MSKKKNHGGGHHEEHVDESWLIPYADLLTLLLALFIVLYAMSAVDAKKMQQMSEAFSVAFSGGMSVLEQPAPTQTGPDTSQNTNKLDDPGQVNVNQPNKQSTADAKAAAEIAKKVAIEELKKKEQQQLENLKQKVDNYIKKNNLTAQLSTKLTQSQLVITISDNALFASGSDIVKPESKKLAVAISKMLGDYTTYEIVVSGHTDNQPISTSEFNSNWDLSSSRAIRFMDILLANAKLVPGKFSAIGYGEYRPISSNATPEGRAKNRRVEISIIRKFLSSEELQTVPATPKP